MNQFQIEHTALTALKTAFASLGVEVSHFNRSSDAHGTRIEFRFVDNSEAGKQLATLDYNRKATMVGMPPDTLGHQFVFKKRIYTIRGINPAASRFNVDGERDDGKIFRFPADQVAVSLQAAAAVQLNKGR